MIRNEPANIKTILAANGMSVAQRPVGYWAALAPQLYLDSYAKALGLVLQTAPKFLFPALIINTARLVFPTYRIIYEEFSDNAYYNGSMLAPFANITNVPGAIDPAIQRALTMDLAIVRAEGADITTTVAVSSVVLFLVCTGAYLLWLLPKNYCCPSSAEEQNAKNQSAEAQTAQQKASQKRIEAAYAARKNSRRPGKSQEAAQTAKALAKEASEAAKAALNKALETTYAGERSQTAKQALSAVIRAQKAAGSAERELSDLEAAQVQAAEPTSGCLTRLGNYLACWVATREDVIEESAERASIAAIRASNAAIQAEEIHAHDALRGDSWLVQKAKAINEYSDQLAKYCMVASTIGMAVGVYLMNQEASKVQTELGCEGFPLWRIARGNCQPESLLLLLSFDSYIWAGISLAGLGTYTALMVLNPLLTAFHAILRFTVAALLPRPLDQFAVHGLDVLRSTLSNQIKKINHRYDTWLNGNNREKWLYQDLSFHWFLPGMVTLIGFAALDSTAFSNRFVQQSYCGASIWEVLKSLFIEENTNDQVCDGSQRALALSTSFLGNFELGRVWPIYFCYRAFTFMSGSIINLGINHLPYLSPGFRSKLHHRALQQRDWLNREAAAAQAWLGVGVVVAGCIAFFPAEKLGNDILKNGLYATIQIGGLIDQEQIIPPCNHTLNNLYLNSLISNDIGGCSQILVSRAFSGFIAPFWLCVTALALTAFSVRMYTPMLFSVLKNLFEHGLKPVGNPMSKSFENCGLWFNTLRNKCCPKKAEAEHLLRDFTGAVDDDGRRMYAVGNYGSVNSA